MATCFGTVFGFFYLGALRVTNPNWLQVVGFWLMGLATGVGIWITPVTLAQPGWVYDRVFSICLVITLAPSLFLDFRGLFRALMTPGGLDDEPLRGQAREDRL